MSNNDKSQQRQVRHEPDPSVDPREYSLDSTLVQLILGEPFYGTVSGRFPKMPDWKCDTAYVSYSEDGIRLGYNPEFMRSLTPMQKQKVIVHELLHVIFGHVTDRSYAERKKAKMWNIATDLAINSIIAHNNRAYLPDFCLMPGEAPKESSPEIGELIKGFPVLQTADFYMDKLEQFVQQQKENGEGGEDGEYEISIGDGDGTLDDHGQWGSIPDEMKDIIREKVREAISKGMEQVQKSAQWGSVPESIRGLIASLLEHEVDWQSILRRFVERCRSSERDSTVKRINKKVPYKFPGVKRKQYAKLLWAIDQSGSMSDAEVQLGLAEAFACSMQGEIDVINFDTEVDETSFNNVKRGQNFKWVRTRCGGTDFNCVADYVSKPQNSGKWSGVVIMTDGYADNLRRMPLKVLWLVTPSGTMERVRMGDLAVKMTGKKDK